MLRTCRKQMYRIFCLTVLTVLVGCGTELTDIEYVQRARDALDKNDYAAAIIDLKSALAMNVNNAEARWELGKIYLKVGDLLAAEKELESAQKLGVDEEHVVALLAQVYLPLGKYSEVHALSIKPFYSLMVRSDLLASRALAFLAEGHIESAENMVASATEIAADSAYVQYAKAAILMDSGKIEAAQKVLEKMLENDKRYAPAWSLLGDLQSRVNNMEDAESAYGNAIANRLNNANDLLRRAMVRIYQNKLDLAQQDIEVLKQRDNKNPRLNYAEGLILYLKKDFPAAQASFEKVISVESNNYAAVFYLGTIHYGSGNAQQAQNYLSKVVSNAPGFLPARKLLATQKLELKEFKNAEELLRPVINKETVDVNLIGMYANALFGVGKKDEGLKWLELAEQLEPASAEAKSRLGQGLMLIGDQASAIDTLNAAIQLDPDTQQADVLLVHSYLQTSNYDAALRAAEDFVARQPDNPAAHNLVGLTMLTKKRVEDAKQAFKKALDLSPGYPFAGHNLAQLAISDSDFEKARGLYKEILSYNPDNLDTLIKFAALEAQQGNNDEMRKYLKQATAVYPDEPQPKIILAKSFLLENRPNEALDVIGDVAINANANPELIDIFGQIQMQNGAYLEASHTFLRLIEETPQSAQAHFFLGLAYARLGEGEKMEQAFIRTLELDDRHILARIALARTQILKQELNRARDNVQILKKLAPNLEDVLKLEALLKAQ